MAGSLLLIFGMFSTTTFAATDVATGSRSVGGVKTSYTNVLSYTDVRCGVNTRAHYRGYAPKKIGSMNVNWNVKNGAGIVRDSSEIGRTNVSTINDKSKDRLDIAVSTAKFTFKNKGTKWAPTSRAYHCIKLKSLSSVKNSVENFTDEEKDILELKKIYHEIKANKNLKTLNSNSTSEETVKSIVKNLLTNNAEELTGYQHEDKKQVSLDDFEITSVKAENSTSPVADNVTFSNPDAANTTIIEAGIKEPVYKNGEKYKVTGYVLLIDKNGENLESGIAVTPL